MKTRSLCFVCLTLAWAAPASAQALDPCIPSSTPISVSAAGDVARYTADAGTILSAPEGSADDAKIGIISSRVRNLLVISPGSLEALEPLMRVATGDEANGLGIGLGTAAQLCVRRNPVVAQEIQKAVLEANNDAVAQVFAGIIGDQAVLSVGDAPSAPVAGETNVGGGSHRGTTDLTYGFRSGTPPLGGVSPFLAPAAARSSGSAFSSVSGFR